MFKYDLYVKQWNINGGYFMPASALLSTGYNHLKPLILVCIFMLGFILSLTNVYVVYCKINYFENILRHTKLPHHLIHLYFITVVALSLIYAHGNYFDSSCGLFSYTKKVRSVPIEEQPYPISLQLSV